MVKKRWMSQTSLIGIQNSRANNSTNDEIMRSLKKISLEYSKHKRTVLKKQKHKHQQNTSSANAEYISTSWLFKTSEESFS
jgi:hypothetical protein